MKLFLKLAAIIFFTLLLAVFYLPKMNDRYQTKQVAKDVLNHLVAQEFEQAFEGIHYYDKASDLEATIAYKEAKNIWVKRMKKLKENGTYIVDFDGLRVNLDDTYPEGEVDLILMENGKQTVKKHVYLWFGYSKNGWGLGNFQYYNGDNNYDEIEEWEKALSGHIESTL